MKARFLQWMFVFLSFAIKASADDIGWNYDPYAYQYDMTVYVELASVDGNTDIVKSNYQIAAFCNGDCRGIAEARSDGGHSYIYLRVRSNAAEGETITFKVKDITSGQIGEARETIVFGSRETVGYPSAPFQIHALLSTFLLGDVNEDGRIDNLDVSATLSIMNGNPGSFNTVAADANQDGGIDILDVLRILELMSSQSRSLLSAPLAMAEDVLQVLPVETTAGRAEVDQINSNVSVQMVNTGVVKALQFDLYLPEGVTISRESRLATSRMPSAGGENPQFHHSVEIADKGDGHYFVVCYASSIDYSISGNSGEIFALYHMTSADIQSGVYPVRMENVVLGIDGYTGVRPATSVSYVKVGTPGSNTVYDLGGTSDEPLVVPSFVQAELDGEKNIVVNETCKNLVLEGSADFYAPKTFTASNASYSRELRNAWGTMCLPFRAVSDADVQYYKLTSVSDDKMHFIPVASVEAGVPSVFKNLSGNGLSVQSADVSVAISATSEPQDASQWTLNGTFATKDNDPEECANDIYYIADNKFWYADRTFEAPAFRAWFETPKSADSRLRVFSISESDGATGINVIEHPNGSVDVMFDLSGKKMPAARRGINIINGKKVVKP